jgi:drug/metabolite transporter (DMT)-like permease
VKSFSVRRRRDGGGAFLGALYFLMRRLVPSDQRAGFFPYILTVYGVAWAVLLTTVMIAGQGTELFAHSGRTWFWFFLLAFCCTMVGHSLYNKALDFFKAHVVGSWVLTEPFIAAGLAWLLLDEPMNWHVLWGVIPMYAGVVWILWLEKDG